MWLDIVIPLPVLRDTCTQGPPLPPVPRPLMWRAHPGEASVRSKSLHLSPEWLKGPFERGSGGAGSLPAWEGR